MATVFLHIGLMKSGTSFVQRVLQKHRRAFKESGLLFPGQRWRDQVVGVEEVVGAKGSDAGAWDALCEQVMDFEGDAVISMESMAVADSSAIARIVGSFGDRRVRVVITARDLARVVPAQWQESLKNGADVAFDRYLRIIAVPGARRLPPARFFWRLHDLPRVLARWREHVDGSDVVLVTVPPSGSPSDLLWERFCEALERPMAGVDLDVRRNDSLGAHSAELLRRVNALRSSDENRTEQRVIKHVLAKQILVNHRESEPSITLPSQYLDWAAKMSASLVEEVRAIDPVVIGDPDELVVERPDPSGGREPGPSLPSDAELNQLALITILDLVQRIEPKAGGNNR
jgi:hypothetical protein